MINIRLYCIGTKVHKMTVRYNCAGEYLILREKKIFLGYAFWHLTLANGLLCTELKYGAACVARP